MIVIISVLITLNGYLSVEEAAPHIKSCCSEQLYKKFIGKHLQWSPFCRKVEDFSRKHFHMKFAVFVFQNSFFITQHLSTTTSSDTGVVKPCSNLVISTKVPYYTEAATKGVLLKKACKFILKRDSSTGVFL